MENLEVCDLVKILSSLLSWNYRSHSSFTQFTSPSYIFACLKPNIWTQHSPTSREDTFCLSYMIPFDSRRRVSHLVFILFLVSIVSN